MEIRLMVPTVVGGHGSVVRSGRVQRGRVEVRVEHVGGRRGHGGHGWRLDSCRVFDGRGRRHRGCCCCGRGSSGRRQFSLRPARGQKVPQVRLVPAPRLRRLRLTGRAGTRGGAAGRHRPWELFRVAEVAVRQARVQIAHFEVHGPFSK